MSRTGRTAIVTGASGGIGRAVAVRLAEDGFDVVVHYATGEEAARETVALVEAEQAKAIAVQADIADEQAVVAMFDQAESTFGGVDVVVNCAGWMPLSPIAELDLDVLDGVLRTNVRGHFVVAQQAVRRLRAGGSFIGMSTSVVGTQFPTYGAYVASKGAVEAVTLIIAKELRGRDVTSNTVAPGPTETALFTRGKTQEQIDASAKAAPLGRLGQPDDIAGTVAFLASPAGHWVNGQTIRVNGGLV